VNGTARVQGELTTTADAVVNGVNVGRGGGNISSNVRFGVNALASNSTGSSNIAIGNLALQQLQTGSGNIGIGNQAGRVSNITGSNSIFIGDFAQSSTNGSNQIVIGVGAQSLGSNTTVIGNSSTTFGRWYGNLLIGTSTNSTFALDVNGTARVQGAATITAATSTSGTAPLIVNQQNSYANPFTQFVQYWNVNNSTIMSLRADGALDTIGNVRSNTLRLNGIGTNSTTTNMLTRNGQESTGINFLSGHVIGFTANGSESMRIVSSGNILINTTTDAGFRLDVNGTARVQGVLTTTADAVVNGVNIGRGGSNRATNTITGASAGVGNTSGIDNSFFGNLSGNLNTSGQSNSFFGSSAGFSNTTGSSNIYIGVASGRSNTSGGSNLFFGNSSGRFIADGTTVNAISNQSIYIGNVTKANANNETNQIVIGHDATGLGSNTTVIGNASTTFGRWFGNLLIGNSSNSGEQLQVTGTAKITGVATFNSTINALKGDFGSAFTSTNVLQAFAPSATDANLFQVGMVGVSNGFSIQRVSSNLTYVFNDGNVGIGTASPVTRLMVQDSGNTFVGHFSGLNQTNGIAIGTNSSNVAVIQGYTRTFSATNNIAMQVDGGNVLIGTTTDVGGRLGVKSSGTNTYPLVVQRSANTNTLAAIFETSAGDASFFLINSSGSTNVQLLSNGTSILNGGNVMIGTASDSGDTLRVTGGNGNTFTNTITTYRPGVNTIKSDAWKLGRAALGTQPTETHQITVEIGGVSYVIGAAQL
jgi:hypothetical protein